MSEKRTLIEEYFVAIEGRELEDRKKMKRYWRMTCLYYLICADFITMRLPRMRAGDVTVEPFHPFWLNRPAPLLQMIDLLKVLDAKPTKTTTTKRENL